MKRGNGMDKMIINSIKTDIQIYWSTHNYNKPTIMIGHKTLKDIMLHEGYISDKNHIFEIYGCPCKERNFELGYYLV